MEHFKFFYTIAKLRVIRQPKAGSIVVRTVRCADRATQGTLACKAFVRQLSHAKCLEFCNKERWILRCLRVAWCARGRANRSED